MPCVRDPPKTSGRNPEGNSTPEGEFAYSGLGEVQVPVGSVQIQWVLCDRVIELAAVASTDRLYIGPFGAHRRRLREAITREEEGAPMAVKITMNDQGLPRQRCSNGEHCDLPGTGAPVWQRRCYHDERL